MSKLLHPIGQAAAEQGPHRRAQKKSRDLVPHLFFRGGITMAGITTSAERGTHRANQCASARRADVNVGDTERWLSMIGGGTLAAYGLSRGGLGGLALAVAGGALAYRGFTGHCSLYGLLGFNTAETGPATSVPAGQGFRVETRITINRSPEDLFRFWRSLDNLPHIMKHLRSVTTTAGNRSHWVAEAPLSMGVEWDAEIINERPNELIAWRSLEGSQVDSAGSVHFQRAPGGGTNVIVVLKYEPPAGQLGAALAGMFGENPERQIEEDLRRFKQKMETGAITAGGEPVRRFTM
jgi:uncharacterized membrane protein